MGRALDKLSRRFPSPPELRDTMAALQHDTDRSVAIVAASIADNALERVLRAYMRTGSPALLDSLFNNRGPMSDFHGKIQCAEAFRVISPAMASELRLIRRIRNVFAHAATDITFQTDEIAAAMKTFAILNAADSTDSGMPMPRDKAGYLMVVSIILVMLDSDVREKGGEPIYAD